MDDQMSDTSATPESVAPVSDPAALPSQRPGSMLEAFAQVDAAQAAADTPEPTETEGSEAAIAPPEGTPETPPLTKQGPIPLAVHTKALENARIKAREEAKAEIAQEWAPYAWAKSLNQAQVQAYAQAAQQFVEAPTDWAEAFVTQLQHDPTHGPKIRSWLGRELGKMRGQGGMPPTAGEPPAPAASRPAPDVEIVDASGRVTGRTYSDQAIDHLVPWITAQIEQRMSSEYGPLKAAHQQAAVEAANAARQAAALETSISQQYQEVLDLLDGDDRFVGDVAQALIAHPEWSARKAALSVRDTRLVAPKLQPQTEQAVLSAHRRKAAGNTVSSAGSAAPPTRPRTAHELAAWMAAHDTTE